MFDVESIMEPNSETSNNGWYTQTTTVEVPSSRIDFCVVSVSAPDNSSVNIYMYGGKGFPICLPKCIQITEDRLGSYTI